MNAHEKLAFQRTGAQYFAALRDDRHVVYGGKRVPDVSSHFALSGGARTIASLIDLHHGDERDAMNFQCPATGREYAMAYMIPRSPQQMKQKGAAFRNIARATGGLMARTPDFLATMLTSWRAASEVFGGKDARYAHNVVSYYERSRDRHWCHSHAISDPPPDRFLDVDAGDTLTLRKVGETRDGIIVRGIKMLATLSPIADELLIYPFRPLNKDDSSQALAFAIPVDTPGLKLVCRGAIARGGAQFEHPLAEKFDEMDALCVFDDVIVPHDRVFIDGDVGFANALRTETGMVAYVWHQTASRAAVKSQMVLGLASMLARLSGRDKQPSVQEMLGELAAGSEVLRALVVAAEAESVRDRFGNYVPALQSLGASNVVAAKLYARSIDLLRLIGASGLIMHPSELDLLGDASDGMLRYFAASNQDAGTHVQLMKLASDLAIGDFGGRQLLYEQFYLGAPQALQARFFQNYASVQDAERLVETLLVQPGTSSIG